MSAAVTLSNVQVKCSRSGVGLTSQSSQSVSQSVRGKDKEKKSLSQITTAAGTESLAGGLIIQCLGNY